MVRKAKKSDWIEWNGGNRPVKSNVGVEVELSDGRTDKGNAAHFYWQHYCSASDIIRYREISAPEIHNKRSYSTEASNDRMYSDPETVGTLVRQVSHLKGEVQKLRKRAGESESANEKLLAEIGKLSSRLHKVETRKEW